MRRGVAALAIALAAAGCMGDDAPPGSITELDVVESGPMRFVAAPPAGRTDVPVGLTHMHFFDSRRGIGATTAGFRYARHVGYEPTRDAARLVSTRDGGDSWRTVWRLRGATLTGLEFVDRSNGIAVGHRVIGSAIPSHAAVGRPFVVRTRDGGRRWRRLDAPAHSVRMAAPEVWYAVGEGKLFLTGDAGGSWRRVDAPPGLVSLEPISHDAAAAVARAASCRARQQLWRTTDRGSSWRPVAGTCAASLTSVEFVGSAGYVATGNDENAHGFRSLLASSDGGRSWATRFRDGRAAWPPVYELRFADARNGWAYALDSYQPQDVEALFVTHDGGRTWRSTRFPGRPGAVLGAGAAWAGDDRDAALWRTDDSGHSWRVAAGRTGTKPYRLLAASRAGIWVDTPVGTLVSRDSGRSWTTRASPSERAVARLRGERTYTDPSHIEQSGRLVSTGRPAPLPPGVFLGFSVYADAEHALAAPGDATLDDVRRPVYSTANAGRSWSRLTFPDGLDPHVPVELGPGLVVVPRAYPKRELLLTTSPAGRWQRTPTPAEYLSCDSAVRGEDVWIACSRDIASAAREPSLLLVSSDGGDTWARRTSGRALGQVVATGPGEAWAIASTLVHTVDAGRTWREVPPSLPAGSRAFRLAARWPPRY